MRFNFKKINTLANDMFGYRVKPIAKQAEDEDKEITDLQIIQPDLESGSIISDESEFTSQQIDVETSIKRQRMIIEKYREMSKDATIDFAINEVVNDVINVDAEEDVVEINIADVDGISESIRLKILSEWEYIHDLLKLDEMGHERLRQYYVDGSSYFHVVVNNKQPKLGIRQLIPLDPRYIKRVHEIKRKKDAFTGVDTIISKKEYYAYSTEPDDLYNGGFLQTYGRQLKLAPELVVHVNSGLFGSGRDNGMIYSHLEVAKKPLNILNQLEATLLVFRLTRAPNRYLFSIDVGTLPSKQANAEVMKYAREYRTTVNYDESSGELSTNGKKMALTDNYFLPQREGKGTSIDTLDGSTDFLRDLDDLLYFEKKLRRSTHVPNDRFETEPSMMGSRLSEITRSEWRFQKFIHRIRKRYMKLFKDVLRTQLVLKKVITLDDWDQLIEPNISFIFSSDSIIIEMRKAEILQEKLSTLQSTTDGVGKYYSHEWIRRNVLNQTDAEIESEDKLMKAEENDPKYQVVEEGGF